MDNSSQNVNHDKKPPSGGLVVGVVSRGNCINQYTWGDGCYGWNFIDTDELSVKQELMPTDTQEKLHYHQIANQFFFILKGKANFTVDGKEYVLKPNEGIEVKPGQQHFISNKNETDLEFILYSQPSTKNDRHYPGSKTHPQNS